MWDFLRRISYFFYSQKRLNEELINAVGAKDLNAANALIAAGANVNIDVEVEGYYESLLAFAMEEYSIEIAIALIKAGADVNVNVNARDIYYTPLLIYALEMGSIEIATALIEAGADVNVINNMDETALIKSAHEGHLKKVVLLIEAGADVYASDEDGCTALMKAARYNDIEVIDALLANCTLEERQALFNQVDQRGTNAITQAFENGHHDAVTVLQQYGAVLPAHLAAHHAAAAGVNAAQSTHEVSVHESVSCSILGLASQYLPGLSDEEREALIVKCGDDKHKAQMILEKALKTEAVQIYIEERLGFALEFADNVKEKDCQFDEHNGLKTQAAKRGIQRVLDDEDLLYFEDSRSKVPMALAMGLVWDGLWDVENKNIEHLKRHEKNEIWVQAFYEMQRGYNLDEDGKETAPDEADSYICVPGHFNKLVSALAGDRHPRVEIIIVTKVIARLRTQALIGKYYLKNVPFDDMMKYFGEIESTGRLPQKLWEDYLRDEITQIVKTEYQSFIEAEMITDAIVQKAINEAKDMPLSGEVIKKILKPLSFNVEMNDRKRRNILDQHTIDDLNGSEDIDGIERQMARLALESSENAAFTRGNLSSLQLQYRYERARFLRQQQEEAQNEGSSSDMKQKRRLG